MEVETKHGLYNKAGQLLYTLIVISFVCAITSCASRQNIKDRSDWLQATSSGNKSIVFGRIQWLDNGVEKQIGNGLFEFTLNPFLYRMEDKTKSIGEINDNGEFVWALEPGIYVINRMNFREPWAGTYFVVPHVAFMVPDKGKVYYVGTLKCDFKSKRDLIGGLSGPIKVEIEDQGDVGNAPFLNRFDVTQSDIKKSLMVYDQNLPNTIDTSVEYNVTLRILHAIFSHY